MSRILTIVLAVCGALLVSGCAIFPQPLRLSARDCLTRVMYFESNRSSAEGMLAVGTVVVNRMNDANFPHSICGVVGQPNQFAPGVLWNPMQEGAGLALARQVADQVMHGARHPAITRAMFFHTAGYHFPYTNMHYVLVAGGNAFYEKW